jgi:hypothetical protein
MTVGLLQKRGLMDGVLESAFTSEQERQRQDALMSMRFRYSASEILCLSLLTTFDGVQY